MSDSEIAQISEQKFKNFKICRGNHQISRKTPEKKLKIQATCYEGYEHIRVSIGQ